MVFVRELLLSFIIDIIVYAAENKLSQYSIATVSPLRHMVISNETIYVGGVGGIASYHRGNITEKSLDINNSNVWLLLYDEDSEEIIQCNQNYDNMSHCSKLGASLQKIGNVITNMSVDIQYLPTYSMIYVKEVNTSIVVIGANSAKILNKSYGILSFNLADFTLFNTEPNRKGPMNIERADEEKIKLSFKSSFYRAPHVYFFFQVYEFNQFVTSRIGKLCLNYENSNNSSHGYHHSYEDMNITCSYNGINLTKIENVIDEGKFAIFLFLHNNANVICKRSWINIEKDFNESRRLQLLCKKQGAVQVKRDEEYFEKDIELGSFTHCFINETYCDKGDVACKVLEGDFCNIKQYHTLVGGQGIKNMDFVYNINKTITAMDILQTSNYSVLYFGTIDGTVDRVYLHTGQPPQSNRRPLLSVPNTTIINIKVEKDGVYFITESEIGKINIEDCSIHKNCESCMNSLNISCGWDYSENRCSINNSNSSLWMTSGVGFCMHFSLISGQIQIITEDTTAVQFQTSPPIPATEEGDVHCTVNGSQGTVKIDDVGKGLHVCYICIKSLQTGYYTFELIYRKAIVGKAMIEFFKCQDFNTCKKCINKGYLCDYWDMINFECGNQTNGNNATSLIKDEGKCPSLRNDLVLHLHSKGSENLIIPVKDVQRDLINAMDLRNFTCEIGQHDRLVQSVEAQWKMYDTSVSCIGIQLLKAGQLYTIRLKYNNMYFDGEITLNVYTCGSFKNEKDCSNSSFVKNCQWNNSLCIEIKSRICSQNKDNITVEKIYPISGPVKGGTLIIVSVMNEDDDPDYFFIDGAKCANITEFDEKDDFFDETTVNVTDTSDEKNSLFRCITGKVSEPNNGTINMSFKGCPSPILKNTYFTYKNPGDIQNFYPNKGILAGNTTITISGQNIAFEGPDRYNIELCDESGVPCIECSILDSVDMKDSKIMCKTGESDEPRNLTKLVVVIDTSTTLRLRKTFRYLPNPTFNISNETLKAIESGGSTFTINGDGFNNVGQITVERVDEPCEVPSDKQAVCQTPEQLPNQPNVQTVIVNFDGIARAVEINYVDDPSFERFDGVMKYDKESSIAIKGKNILNGARFDDYNIQVGFEGKCLISEISDITMDFIKCVPPKNVPRTNKSDVNTVHVIVVVGKITAYIGDLQYKEDDNQFSLIIGLLTGGLVTSIIIGFTAVFISRRSKKRFMVKCKMEMSKDLSERRENSGNNDELRRIEGNEMAYSEINPARQFDSHTNSISHQDVHNGYEKLGPCSPTNPYNWLQQSATDNQIADKEIGNNDELRRIEGIEMAYSEINPAAELNSNTNSKSHQDVHNEYEKLGPCSPTNPYNWLQQSATDNQIADKEIGNNDELRRIEGNEMAYSEINPAAELNSNINSKGHQDVHNEYEKLGPCSPTNPYNWLQQSATDNQIADKEIGNNDELKRIEGNEMAYSEINPAAELNSNTNSIGHQDVHNEYEKLGPCSPTNPYNWLQQSATDNQIADKEIGNNDELKRIEGNEMAYSEINPAAELNSNTHSIGHQDVHNEYEKLGPCSPTNPYNWLQQSATDNQMRNMINVDNCTVSACDYMNLKL